MRSQCLEFLRAGNHWYGYPPKAGIARSRAGPPGGARQPGGRRREMKWRWRLGQVFGIVVYMHVTFLLLIAWIAFIPLSQGRGLASALYGVLFILLLFLCVVMHEYGHALTARRYGIETRDITLLPIGGVSSLERMPRDPAQEMSVALAGPAVNGVIAALLTGLIYLLHRAPTFANAQ